MHLVFRAQREIKTPWKKEFWRKNNSRENYDFYSVPRLKSLFLLCFTHKKIFLKLELDHKKKKTLPLRAFVRTLTKCSLCLNRARPWTQPCNTKLNRNKCKVATSTVVLQTCEWVAGACKMVQIQGVSTVTSNQTTDRWRYDVLTSSSMLNNDASIKMYLRYEQHCSFSVVFSVKV